MDLGLPAIVDLAALAKKDPINKKIGGFLDGNRKLVGQRLKHQNFIRTLKSKLKRMEIFTKNGGRKSYI